MSGKSPSKLCPMFPPSQVRRPSARRISAVIAAVVDLPFDPVTPMTFAGQASRNNSISVVIVAPLCRASFKNQSSGRTAGLTTTTSARRKSTSRCPPSSNRPIGKSVKRSSESPSVPDFALSVTVTVAPRSATKRAAATPPPWRPRPMIVTRRPERFMNDSLENPAACPA